MTDPYSLQKLRLVGLLEKFSTARHSLDLYKNIGVSVCYSKPTVSFYPLNSLVFRALESVIARHPILSAIPVDEDKPTPYFARLPHIDLRDAVKFIARKENLNPQEDHDSEDRELDEILEGQHNLNFRGQRYGELPFWRLLIIHNDGSINDNASCFTACFIYHHGIGDGTSGLIFHRSFFSALQTITDSTEDDSRFDPVIGSPEKPLLPNVEKVYQFPVSVPYIFKAQWNEWFPKGTPELWTASPITDSPSKRTCRVRSFTLSKANTDGLLAASRAQSTTLTATIEVILSGAIFAHLVPVEDWSMLRFHGAISLRRWLPSEIIDDDAMGTYVSRYSADHKRPPRINNNETTGDTPIEGFSWQETRRVRTAIEAELSRRGNNAPLGLLPYIPDFHNYFKGQIGKQRGESVSYSNVGVYKPCQDRASGKINKNNNSIEQLWKSGRMMFSQSSDVTGGPIHASLVTGADGRLTIALSWLEGIVDGDLIRKILQQTQEMIGQLVVKQSQNN